jgi:hypothetical protein
MPDYDEYVNRMITNTEIKKINQDYTPALTINSCIYDDTKWQEHYIKSSSKVRAIAYGEFVIKLLIFDNGRLGYSGRLLIDNKEYSLKFKTYELAMSNVFYSSEDDWLSWVKNKYRDVYRNIEQEHPLDLNHKASFSSLNPKEDDYSKQAASVKNTLIRLEWIDNAPYAFLIKDKKEYRLRKPVKDGLNAFKTRQLLLISKY